MFRLYGRPKDGHAFLPKFGGTTDLLVYDPSVLEVFATHVIGTPTSRGGLRRDWFFVDASGVDTYLPVDGSKLDANRLVVYGWVNTKGRCDLYFQASNIDDRVLAMDSRKTKTYAASGLRGLVEMPIMEYNNTTNTFTQHGIPIQPRDTIGPIVLYDSHDEWSSFNDPFCSRDWSIISGIIGERVKLTGTRISKLIEQWTFDHHWRPMKRTRMAPVDPAPAASVIPPPLHQAVFAPPDAGAMQVQATTITKQEQTILDLKSTIEKITKERDDAIINASQMIDQVHRLRTANERNNEIIKETREKLTRTLGQMENTKKEIDRLKQEISRLKMSNESMRSSRGTSNQNTGARMAEMEKTIRRQQGRAEQQQKIIEDLGKERDRLRAEIKKLRRQITVPPITVDAPVDDAPMDTPMGIDKARDCLSFVGSVLEHPNGKKPFLNVRDYKNVTTEAVALAGCLSGGRAIRDAFVAETLAPRIEEWAETCPQDGKTVAVGTRLRVSFEVEGGDFIWCQAIIIKGNFNTWTLFFPDDNTILSGFKTTCDLYYGDDTPTNHGLWDFLIDPE